MMSFVEKALNHLKEGTEDTPKFVALQFDEDDEECVSWGLYCMGDTIYGDNGQCVSDRYTDDEAAKLIEEYVDEKNLDAYLM